MDTREFSLTNERLRCLSISEVQRAVARAFNLSLTEMLSRGRSHRVARARQVAMYLSRELAGGGSLGPRRMADSFPRIGLAFARDHTSVIHACNAIARRRLRDAAFAHLLDDITREVIEAPRPAAPPLAA